MITKPMKIALLSLAVLLILKIGCQSPKDYNQGNGSHYLKNSPDVVKIAIKSQKTFNHTILHDTPYYKDGPQQARPPDGIFKSKTKIKLIEDAGSYLFVESAENVKAYVAKESVR